MRIKLNSIKCKLGVLLGMTILLILLLIGVSIGALAKHFYTQEVDRDFAHGYAQLGRLLHQMERQQADHAQRLAGQDELIAGLNMIVQYSRPEDYQPLIFDNEKRRLLDVFSNEIQAGNSDEIILYDHAGQLLGFASNHTTRLTGHLSFRQGEPFYLISQDHRQGWQQQLPPDYIVRHIEPPAWNGSGTPAMRLGFYPVQSGLLIRGMMPVLRHFPDGSWKVLAYLQTGRILDASFIREFSLQSGIEVGLLLDNEVKLGSTFIQQQELHDVARITSLSLPLPYTRLERPDHSLAILEMVLMDGSLAKWILSQPTETIQAAISNARWLILSILVLASAIIFPFALWLTNRVATRPLQDLNDAVATLHQGNYQITIPVRGRDEIGQLSMAFNAMASTIHQRQLEQQETEKILRQSATVFENTADGVIVTDLHSRIIAVNRAFTRITGYEETEALGQKTSFRRSERQGREFYIAMWEAINNAGHWQGEIWNRRKSGEVYPEWMTISVVRDSEGTVTNYVAVFSDITQVKHSQMQLDHMANHDPLTDLPNRTLLDDRLRQAIYRAARQGGEIAVLFIDLDRFKNVNDTFGHPTGDRLLQEVAHRFQEILHHQDTVARLGGDEFIILLEEQVRPELIEAVASKVIEAMSRPFQINNKEFFLGASIGVSLYPEDGQDADTLIKHADAAMYRAKDAGRNTWQYYTRELTEQASERLMLESALRRAMDHAELEVYYQPKVDLQTGRIIAAEALLRWKHPEMGFIPPDRFISLAEENGLIVSIGEWVLNESCQKMAEWAKAYPCFQHIAVNLSGVQIQRSDIVGKVSELLALHGLQARQLHLEITESVLMQYPEQAMVILEGLRDLGISLAVDDFGTGYSSLSYLKRFPIDALKIDRSFVMDIPHDSNDSAITRAVIALGKSLQLQIIAEGVETLEQELFLQQEGCDLGQGYYYSRPVPADEFAKLLQANCLPLNNVAASE